MAEQTLKHLVRIANADLEGAKPLGHALLKIHGVSFPFAQMVCTLAKIDRTATTGMLSDEQIALIDRILKAPLQHGAPVWMVNRRRDYETNEDRHLVGADIAFVQENDIKRLKKIRSYRGIRHGYGLPVRGQRTRSNFRKNKGKVHLGVQRKKVEATAAAEGKKGGKEAGKKEGGKKE